MKASGLKDRAVISMADGQQIGRVQDVLFETANLRVAGFAVDGTGGRSVLPFGSATVGPDAVMVAAGTAAQQSIAQAIDTAWHGFSNLAHLKVLDQRGTELGEIRDIEFDEQTGHITQLDVHHGGVLGLGGDSKTIPVSGIRALGPQMVTVDTSVSPEPGKPTPA
jgi:sporulation protein YlmC with PRC-barrel domain